MKFRKMAELSCQQKKMRSDRGQKRKPAQKSTKGKNAGEKSGQEPSLKLKDVSTGLYKLIEIGRSQNKQKKLGKPKKDCFRSRDDEHAIFIRSLLYSRYGQDKTRQHKTRTLFILHRKKKHEKKTMLLMKGTSILQLKS